MLNRNDSPGHEPIVSVSSNSGRGVRALSVRLARAACDLDDVVQALAAEPLTEGHTILLAGPAAHLAIAIDNLDQIVHDLDHYGRSDPSYVPLTLAEANRLAA